MKKRGIIICLVLVNLFLAGCNSCLPEAIAEIETGNNAARTKALAKLEKRVLKLKTGSTIQDAKKAFGSKGVYLFTIQKGEHNYLCISFPVGQGYGETGYGFSYYTIFEDKKLYSVMEKLPCKEGLSCKSETKRVGKTGWSVSYMMSSDPNVILSAKGLFGQNLVNSIRENFPKEKNESNLPLPIPVLIIWYPLHSALQSVISGVLPNDCNCN